MITPMEVHDTINIVNNFKRVITSGNIDLLTKKAYRFIILYFSCIIAHYSVNGFKGYYNNVTHLIIDIKRFYASNMQLAESYSRDKWFTDRYGILYCKSVTDTMKGILGLIEQ